MENRPESTGGWGSRALRLGVAATLASAIVATPRLTASASSAHAGPPYTIGVSNTVIGNGWRDEMICSIKAQARASGLVRPGGVHVVQTAGGAAQQIADIRNLIAQRVNAIILDPSTPTALNGVIAQAAGRGIKVVVIDQFITSNVPYQVANNQVAYGRLGMQWLVNQLHGHGNIAILNGIKGAPADTDRITGQDQVLSRYPGIHVVARQWTNWDYPTGGKEMLDILNSGKKVDGVWTSGIDYTVVNAFQTAKKKYVPVVGADNNEFVRQLVQLKSKGLTGAAVTNPPPVGGVGAAVALKALQGKSPAKKLLLTPRVWSNTTANGLMQLRAHNLPTKPPTYGAAWNVPGLTSYTRNQLFACAD